MTCFFCKGSLENNVSTFMVELNHCIVIVKNVPSQVCKQCGEVSYSREVAKRLEKIVKAACKAMAEITVVNYLEQVA